MYIHIYAGIYEGLRTRVVEPTYSIFVIELQNISAI